VRSSNTQIYGNIFYDNHAFDVTDAETAKHVEIYNNTFASKIDDESRGTAGFSICIYQPESTGWTIMNNIR
jgi:hypothetical protein